MKSTGKMGRTAACASLLVYLVAVAPVSAQTVSNLEASVVSTRLHELSTQVTTGAGTNQLTAEEEAALRAELNRIESMRNAANTDGYTVQELQGLQAQLDNVSSMLMTMLNNGVNRPIPVAAAPYVPPYTNSWQDQLNLDIQNRRIRPSNGAQIQAKINQINALEAHLNASSPYISPREQRRLSRQIADLRRSLDNDYRRATRRSYR